MVRTHKEKLFLEQKRRHGTNAVFTEVQVWSVGDRSGDSLSTPVTDGA